MLKYHFAVRFRLPERITLNWEERTMNIYLPSKQKTYTLAAFSGESIEESQWLLIKDDGEGFSTEKEAVEAGRNVKNAIMWCSANTRTGVDVGDDKTRGGITKYGIDQLRRECGIRPLNAVHGLQVYEEDPCLPTRFISTSAYASVRKSVQNYEQYFRRAVDMSLELTEKETLAFELYGLSHFESSSRARLLTLTTVVEIISENQPRSVKTMEHVEKLITITSDSSLPKPEIQSLQGSLTKLKQESISKTARDLVERFLGAGQYAGRPAKKFFRDCYAARSSLVHDGKLRGNIVDLRTDVLELDRLVADLLVASVEHSNV